MAEAWPEDLEPTDMTWGVVYNNRAFTSSLTNAQQIASHPGAYWTCTLNFGVLYEEDERELTSLLGRLQGMFGTVNIPSITRTRTDNIGAPVVASAVAQATRIQLRGMTASTRVFSRGDHITILGEMFEVVENVDSDASGAATIQVNKRIRKTIPIGSAVEYRNPYCEMRRVDDTNEWSVQPVVSSGSYQFREAF
ncbi:hypothetical protein DZC75_10735 [Pseudomonas parafulva]|uniref:Prophage PSSB64-02 n=1 Tax=Pseudomonas parafulva TaxID=157782 RepID=A0AAI8KBH0_9PSED|nr:hypothetical protein [Pseudomonas parafulva]AXO88449.1 hypothetical protein DZC75_10735 [Pseudomonas parafulva]